MANQIKITVKFFASLRESVGCAETQVELAEGSQIKQVWQQLKNVAPELPAGVLCALNQDYANWDAQVADGDEVAFFPPVTGG